MSVGSVIMAYLLTFLIAGTPIVVLYVYFMKKLEQIKEENGFTNMDTMLRGQHGKNRGVS